MSDREPSSNDARRQSRGNARGGGGWPPRLDPAPGGDSPFGLLARVVGGIAAVGLLVGALFLGAFVLTILLAVGVIGAIVLRIWLWWKLRDTGSGGSASRGGRGRTGPLPGGGRQADADSGAGGQPRWPPRRGASGRPAREGGQTVEGEYEVIDGEASEDERPHGDRSHARDDHAGATEERARSRDEGAGAGEERARARDDASDADRRGG